MKNSTYWSSSQQLDRDKKMLNLVLYRISNIFLSHNFCQQLSGWHLLKFFGLGKKYKIIHKKSKKKRQG